MCLFETATATPTPHPPHFPCARYSTLQLLRPKQHDALTPHYTTPLTGNPVLGPSGHKAGAGSRPYSLHSKSIPSPPQFPRSLSLSHPRPTANTPVRFVRVPIPHPPTHPTHIFFRFGRKPTGNVPPLYARGSGREGGRGGGEATFVAFFLQRQGTILRLHTPLPPPPSPAPTLSLHSHLPMEARCPLRGAPLSPQGVSELDNLLWAPVKDRRKGRHPLGCLDQNTEAGACSLSFSDCMSSGDEDLRLGIATAASKKRSFRQLEPPPAPPVAEQSSTLPPPAAFDLSSMLSGIDMCMRGSDPSPAPPAEDTAAPCDDLRDEGRPVQKKRRTSMTTAFASSSCAASPTEPAPGILSRSLAGVLVHPPPFLASPSASERRARSSLMDGLLDSSPTIPSPEAPLVVVARRSSEVTHPQAPTIPVWQEAEVRVRR